MMGSGRVKCGRVNYCQYDHHIFAKDKCVRTTVLQWVPRGRSGTGMCREEAGNCSAKAGFSKETRRTGGTTTTPSDRPGAGARQPGL